MKGSLYRKYRPRGFEEFSGQTAVVRVLKSVLKSRDISHAWMFTGPRGTGKTSAAKIFAKTLNCLNPQDGMACHECSHCLSFQKGVYPDYLEMDAASNRGIDEFRVIREQALVAPMAGKGHFKVFVIDEAHMLTKEASNAFLKTLEEPPAWCIFILATTEPEKLLPTIHSRCIRLDFSLISPMAVRDRLKAVALAEGFEVEPAVLDRIVEKGGGGLRDSLTLLEQAVHLCGSRLNTSEYLEMSGETALEQIDLLLMSIIQKEPRSLMTKLNNLYSSGKQPADLMRQLLQRVEDGLYLALQVPKEAEKLPEICLKLESVAWAQLMRDLLLVQDSMAHSLFPSMHLQLGLLNASEAFSTQKETTDSRSVESLKKKVGELEKKIQSAPIPAQNTVPVESEIKKPIIRDTTLDELPNNVKNWEVIRRELKTRDPITFALIDPAQAGSESDKLVLYFAPQFQFHFNKVQEAKAFSKIRQLLDQKFNKDYGLELVLGNPPVPSASTQNKENPSSSVNQSRILSESRQGENQVSEELKRKILKDPSVARLVQELDATIESIL
ncbi:MAG: DNA polymerase III subunit gamma/tau [Candidatus Cloacimonetes bacterium]|nr:DNA polymerase III subunit gamma/tau [Candidatus Cloacimonadota bacterium]